MLRYFYLLCFLVYIEWTFCYDISDHRPVRRRAKEMRVKRQRHGDLVRKPHEMEDKDSLSHIDVASFLQQPDYEASMANHYKPKCTDRSPKESRYDNIIALGSINGMNYHMPLINKQQRNENSENNRNAAHEDYSNNDEETRRVPLDKRAHSHVNACSMKQMKFPFFSHKKTVTPKSKKSKKKKTYVSTTNYPVLQSSLAKSASIQSFSDNDKIIKRSYEETFCPLCKRKLGPKRGNSELKKKTKIIHNSRQFYQNAEEGAKAISNKNVQNEVTGKNTLDSVSHGGNRWKRFDSGDEREKHLKEIEDIQNKVDNMDVNKLGAPAETHKGSSDKDKEKEKEKEEMR